MAPDATEAEVKEAYRRAARVAHPDRAGAASAPRMAALNESYRVLRDRDRRRRYDEQLASRAPGVAAAARPAPAPRAAPPHVVAPAPDRFPWRFLLTMAVIGIVVVLVGAALTEPGSPPAPDNVLRAGDCVVLGPTLDAAEVACTGPHDAVVRELVPLDRACPSGTEGFRDRQGMGQACVVRVPALTTVGGP